MRALVCGSLLLAASLTSALALAQTPPEPAPAPPPPEPAPAPAAPTPPPEAPPESAPSEAAPSAGPVPAAAPVGNAPNVSPLDERHPGSGLVLGARIAPEKPTVEPNRYERDYDALRLAFEARFGFNTRLGSSFADSAHEERLDTDYALGGYLSWNREFALGIELEHAGLGRVRALSDQNSVDAEYSATSAWLAARVFPVRRERLDLFVNLRLGMVFQHVDALGTQVMSNSITVPATSFQCDKWDGPGIGLGGAVGVALRLSRHFSFVSRVDATGDHLSGEELGSCTEGIGSVATISGSVGLAYDFATSGQ